MMFNQQLRAVKPANCARLRLFITVLVYHLYRRLVLEIAFERFTWDYFYITYVRCKESTIQSIRANFDAKCFTMCFTVAQEKLRIAARSRDGVIGGTLT